jgi:hypothetical protein
MSRLIDPIVTSRHKMSSHPALTSAASGGVGITVWPFGGGGLSGQPQGEQGDADGGGVGQVVSALGQDSQRVSQDTYCDQTGDQDQVQGQHSAKA